MQTLFSDIAATAGKQFKQHKTTARHRPQKTAVATAHIRKAFLLKNYIMETAD